MFLPERQIPFPLETSKGDREKIMEIFDLVFFMVSLSEISPLMAPGFCEIWVLGESVESRQMYAYSIEDGRLLFNKIVMYMLMGDEGAEALEKAEFELRFPELAY